MTDSALDPLVGRSLGEFVLRERIGQGGFGAVYRAIQPALDREAVIKVLHGRLHASKGAAERFLREAKLASKLDHPYAAHIYAFGAEPDGELWIAMELVRGTPLDRVLASRGSLPLDTLVPLVDRICEVVQTAHDQGIVHRDLKPQNVMVLARAGRLLPKLLDFGIAKALAAPDDVGMQETLPETARDALDPLRTLTEVGAVMGSPHYMAPEQWQDAAQVDQRVDIYALGAMTFQCLTGKPPFVGATIAELVLAHSERPPPKLERGLPEALDAVIGKALAKRPADRYPSALAFSTALREASGVAVERTSSPAVAVESGDLARATPQSITAVIDGSVSHHTQPRAVRRWPVLSLVAVLGVVAVGAGALVVMRRDHHALPSHDRTVGFVARNAGAPSDDELVAAVEHMAAHRLADRELRVRAVAGGAGANVVVAVAFKRVADGVELAATLGASDGEPSQLAAVRADSVSAALDKLLDQVVARAAEGQPARGPDPAEQAAMRELGAPSFDALRGYQAAVRAHFERILSDVAEHDRRARDLVAKYPTWAMPYLDQLLDLTLDPSADFGKLRDAALAQVRDPVGRSLITAFDDYHDGRYDRAIETLQPAFARYPEPVLGWNLYQAFKDARRTQEQLATIARLHEAWPELQFGTNLEGALRQAGSVDAASDVVTRWLAKAPDAEQAWSAQISAELARGDAERALRRAGDLVFLFGSAGRLAGLAEIQLAAGHTADATTTANRMLEAGSAERLEGWFYLAEAAILDGRFSAAREALRTLLDAGAAVPVPFYSCARWEAVALDRVLGGDDSAAALESLVKYYRDKHQYRDKQAQLELTLLQHHDCSALRDALSTVPAEPRAKFDEQRRMLTRIAAAYDCAPCSEVVTLGLASQETHQRLLYEFGICAEKQGALSLARDVFQRASAVVAVNLNPGFTPATAYAVLARLHLARALVALGDKAAARTAYADFLARWGHVDRPIAEVETARRELAALGDP